MREMESPGRRRTPQHAGGYVGRGGGPIPFGIPQNTQGGEGENPLLDEMVCSTHNL